MIGEKLTDQLARNDFRDAIKTAIESGLDTDWVFDGERENPVKTFNSEIAAKAVLRVISKDLEAVNMEKGMAIELYRPFKWEEAQIGRLTAEVKFAEYFIQAELDDDGGLTGVYYCDCMHNYYKSGKEPLPIDYSWMYEAQSMSDAKQACQKHYAEALREYIEDMY